MIPERKVPRSHVTLFELRVTSYEDRTTSESAACYLCEDQPLFILQPISRPTVCYANYCGSMSQSKCAEPQNRCYGSARYLMFVVRSNEI